MRYLFFALLSWALLCYSPAYSQEIKGKVISEAGLRAANITVKFKNSANAVLTNDDGSFKIIAKSLPDTLEFAAVGYEPYKVVVTDKTVKDPNFEIVLLQKRSELSEVVVTGYGAAKKSMGYATAAITPATIDGSVEGRAEGIRIRGVASVKRERKSDIRYEESFISGSTYSTDHRALYFTDSLKIGSEPVKRSKLLTAGEVNDFKKWKMWQDFNDTVFKQFADRWGMYTKHRYSLQLENKEHKAIVAQPVYLVDDNTNDTIWKAVTDNTGKAELWGGIDGSEIGECHIAVRKNDNTVNASEFSQSMNRLQVNKSCGVSNKVDIAFVVDATGSMGDEIEYLKLELEDVIRNSFDKHKDLDLNVGSVFYRDRGDQYLTKHIDFQTDLLKVLNFIKLQSADGGGDAPESVEAALQTALDSLSWSDEARAKIIFLVLDAPPHDYAAKEMFRLIKLAAAKGVRIVPVACSGTDKNTEFLMRSIALATNGTYLFLTNESGVGGAHIKPTTDAFDVELLNTILQRTIEQMVFVPACDNAVKTEAPVKPFENVYNIKLYPNPTTGKLNFECNKQLKEIYITDFTSKILMRITPNAKSKTYQVNLSAYPSATYFIRYVTSDNIWGAEKIIVAR